MDFNVRGLAVDKNRACRHSSFELKRFPVRGINIEMQRIVIENLNETDEESFS